MIDGEEAARPTQRTGSPRLRTRDVRARVLAARPGHSVPQPWSAFGLAGVFRCQFKVRSTRFEERRWGARPSISDDWSSG